MIAKQCCTRMPFIRFAECIAIPSTHNFQTDETCATYCHVTRHDKNKTSVHCRQRLKPTKYRSAIIVYMNSTRRRHISTVNYQIFQVPRHFEESVIIRQSEVKKSYCSVLQHGNMNQHRWFKSSINVPSVMDTEISMYNESQCGSYPRSYETQHGIDNLSASVRYSDINDNLISEHDIHQCSTSRIENSHTSIDDINTNTSSLEHKPNKKKDSCLQMSVDSYGSPICKVPTMYIMKDGTTQWQSEFVGDESYQSDDTCDLESCDLASHISVTSRSTVTSQCSKQEWINEDYSCRSGPFLFPSVASPNDTGYLTMNAYSDGEYEELESRFDDQQFEYMSDDVTYTAEMDDSVESVL